MTFAKKTATRSLLVKGKWLTVEVLEFHQQQSFRMGTGTWIGFCVEFKLQGGEIDFLKVGIDAVCFLGTNDIGQKLLGWLPKAGFATLMDVLQGKVTAQDRFVAVRPAGPTLIDPQRKDMAFFRKRCRYDVLRLIADRLKSPAQSLDLSADDALTSPLLTRLYEKNDIVSAFGYWEKQGMLLGLTFDNTCMIDDNHDEEVDGMIANYDWEETRTAGGTRPTSDAEVNDAFICHASEDKDAFVRLLAEALEQNGLTVWYDEYALKLGDSLRQKIDEGLRTARYGIVVLSRAFFGKNWPQYELDGLVEREMTDGTKVILPIWHKIGKEDVAKYSPTLAGRVAVSSDQPIEEIVRKVAEVIRR